MAAAQSSKSELVAIYRLEFYKKQKSWKYCSEERKREEEKRKAAKKAKVKLNLTYNIQPCPERDTDPEQAADEVVDQVEEEQVEEEQLEEEELSPLALEEGGDDLNKAFVDTGTDGNNTPPSHQDPPNSPYSPKWSIQQWAEQCQPLWHCEPTYPGQPYPVQFDQVDPKYGYTSLPPCGGLPRGEWEGVGLEDGDHGWPTRSQVWINRQENGWIEADIPEEAGPRPAPAGDAIDGAEWALLDRAADWLSATPTDKSEIERCDSLPSISSGSFTRGALQAPHSSEIDLLMECADAATAGLSAAGLAGAVARHAAALRALLAEARRRHQESTSPSEPAHSFEEHPTHDVGPSAPFAPADEIIAGSFRNRPDLRGHAGIGRGRGKVKVIGIGMGRPYRL